MMNPSLSQPVDRRSGSALGLADVAGISLLCLALLILSYLRSRHCMFWGDEIMGWLVLKEPTFHDLLHAWDLGLDSSGLWFEVLGRGWFAVFGATEVSLRMFSATGVAASAAVIWIAARRFYSILPVAAAITFVFALMPTLRWQLANGRTYGLFLLGVSVVLYLLLRGEELSAAKPGPLFLLATFAGYCLLTGSHILGILYTAALLFTQIALDLYSRRLRPLLYLSGACSAIVLFFSRANLRSTAALGKPTYWTVRPTFGNLLKMNLLFPHRVLYPIVALLFLVLLQMRFVRKRTPVYFILLGFAALNLVIFVYSRVTTSIYVDRYLLPFAFAAIFALCEILSQLRDAPMPLPGPRNALAGAILGISILALLIPRSLPRFLPLSNYTGGLIAAIPPGLPIVDPNPGSFVEVEFYQHAFLHEPYLFPVDWQIALDPSNKGGVSGMHEMENFKAVNYFADNIVPAAEVLNQKHDFIVVAAPDDLWLNRRILNNTHFLVTRLRTYETETIKVDLWRVHPLS